MVGQLLSHPKPTGKIVQFCQQLRSTGDYLYYCFFFLGGQRKVPYDISALTRLTSIWFGVLLMAQTWRESLFCTEVCESKFPVIHTYMPTVGQSSGWKTQWLWLNRSDADGHPAVSIVASPAALVSIYLRFHWPPGSKASYDIRGHLTPPWVGNLKSLSFKPIYFCLAHLLQLEPVSL